MRQQKTSSGFTLVELLVVISIIGVLAAVLLPAILDVGDEADVTACSASVKNLTTWLSQYKNRYGRYPQEDGAAFITHLFFVDIAQKAEILKCPGSGAENDRTPDINVLRPHIDSLARREAYDERRQEWDPDEISYTGPYNADPDDGADEPEGGERWRLDHLASPSVEEREIARDEKYPVKSPGSLPLVADDDEAKRNHDAGFNIGFADLHVEFIEIWEDDKFPFAALVRDSG